MRSNRRSFIATILGAAGVAPFAIQEGHSTPVAALGKTIQLPKAPPPSLFPDIKIGSKVKIEGVCGVASRITPPRVHFDLIDVTSERNTTGFREFIPGPLIVTGDLEFSVERGGVYRNYTARHFQDDEFIVTRIDTGARVA
jgi:hypothetical protein